jgi:hypothetical protein
MIMVKDAEEIIARSVILLSISERCDLEKSVIGGISYSKKQREEQRKVVYEWLRIKGYIHHITNDEKILFELEVGTGNKYEILSKQMQYEALEPCLWTLGLVRNLSSYDNFVTNDFSQILQIGSEHTLHKVLDTCSLKSVHDIRSQNRISMLWFWRAIEGNNVLKSKPTIDFIKFTFGKKYEKAMKTILNNGKDDFVVNNKLFSELTFEEATIVRSIAQWRYHAFNWITGDELWNDVEIDT